MGSKNTGKTDSGASVSQYLTFQLAGETYGVPLHQVQEIRTYTPTTRMPNAPGLCTGRCQPTRLDHRHGGPSDAPEHASHG